MPDSTQDVDKADRELMTWLFALSATQIRFCISRVDCSSDKDAADAIGISARTAYAWPSGTKETIRRVVTTMQVDAVRSARLLLERHVLEAASVKLQALRGDVFEGHEQAASTEILDRVLGKPKGSVEVQGDGIVPKMYVSVSPDMWDDD